MQGAPKELQKLKQKIDIYQDDIWETGHKRILCEVNELHPFMHAEFIADDELVMKCSYCGHVQEIPSWIPMEDNQ